MENKKFVIILVLLAGAFIGYAMFGNKSDAGSGSVESSKGSSNYYGKMDSPVTITEFVDFQCEACYAYYPGVKQVKEQYKDRVKFQVRNFPIVSGHQFALQGARAAEAAARQGKFWEMHDKIFEGQKTWERTTDPQSYFDSYAQEIGLDMTKFETDRKSSSVNAVIQKDLKDVQELGGTGTPTFVVNGKRVEKSPGSSVAELSKFVEDALAAAEKNQ